MGKAVSHSGGTEPGPDAVCVPVALSVGSNAPSPSSLRSMVRAVRAAYPTVAELPLADISLVKCPGRAEIRLYFGCLEGEAAPAAK